MWSIFLFTVVVTIGRLPFLSIGIAVGWLFFIFIYFRSWLAIRRTLGVVAWFVVPVVTRLFLRLVLVSAIILVSVPIRPLLAMVAAMLVAIVVPTFVTIVIPMLTPVTVIAMGIFARMIVGVPMGVAVVAIMVATVMGRTVPMSIAVVMEETPIEHQ